MAIILDGSSGVNTPTVTTNIINFGVVGDRRNLEAWSNDGRTIGMSYNAHILSDASGNMVALRSTKTPTLSFDVTAAGVGGMASAVLNGGYIAVYHVFRISDRAEALIGINSDDLSNLVVRTPAPEVCPTASMPNGYTHSALVGVYMIKKTAKTIYAFFQTERKIATDPFVQQWINSNVATLPTVVIFNVPWQYVDGFPSPTNVFLPPPANAKNIKIHSAAWSTATNGVYSVSLTPVGGNTEIGYNSSWFWNAGANGTAGSHDLVISSKTTGFKAQFVPLSTAVLVKHGFFMMNYEI
jgi:hypothetical protein